MTIPFHVFADIFDLISGKAFEELVADVRRYGLRERIVTLDGKILDGRNRYLAAIAAGILSEDDEPDDRPASFQRFVPDVDGDPLSFVFSKNLHRRHLTVGQRSYAIAEFERFRHGGIRQDRTQSEAEQDANLQVAEDVLAAAETRAELAEKGGVSERSVASAAIVRDRGVDDLKAAVKHGAIAVSRAEQIARMPEPEQPAELARALPNGSRAIMSSRIEPDDSLDYFPTPPWAVRALFLHALPSLGIVTKDALPSAWEPACGEGHMSAVLEEFCAPVVATDIFDYSGGDAALWPPGWFRTQDFLDPLPETPVVDWIITNPPFGNKTVAFVLRALELAEVGVAMFVRLQWIEGVGRYQTLFLPHPPTLFSPFAERVPLHKGKLDPDGSTATAYCWLVWVKGHEPRPPFWMPPYCRRDLTHPDDRERFSARPIARYVRPVDQAGAPLVFEQSTGEIVESPSEEQHGETDNSISPVPSGDEPQSSAMASCIHDAGAAVAPEVPRPTLPLRDDGLDIPAFLKRNADNSLSGRVGE